MEIHDKGLCKILRVALEMGNTIYDEMNVVPRNDLTLEQDDIYKILHKIH